MEQMIRVLIFDRTDTYLCDLDPNKVLSLTTTEEVNGEHSLTIRTTQELAKTNRVLVCDRMGYWHEYVIVGTDEEHSDLTETVNEYYCVWSLQYDLSATFVNDQYGAGLVPGHASNPVPASQALNVALGGTNRWSVGTVGVTTRAASSFYRRSGWDAIKTLLEVWGGEIDATITVSTTGVVSRAVDLLTHVGASTAARRFDYGSDLTSIKRTISDDVWPCRIVPLGASQETDAGGYTRRPSIESVNGGVIWLQDDAVVPYVRIPDGSGGWEYPTVIIENDTYEQPADLKAWALAHISEYTRPQVSYEADVLQLARAGLDPHGVALGDEVVAVDRTFGTDGLRISARVVKMVTNLLDKSDITLTIGNARGTLAGQLGDLSRAVSDLAEQVASASQWQSGEDYVSALISRINNEANATGGYTYITEGQGTRTYDVAVSDPLVGAEASQVVEVKGGNIRIANTKDSQGNWEWKTMLQSGYVNSEVLRAIGSGSGGIAEVTANGLMVYLGQTLLASVMADAARYYDGNGTADANVTALFSAALMRMGYATGNRVEVTANGVATRSGSSNNYTLVDSDGFKAYLSNALRMALEATALRVYDGLGTAITNVLASFGETTVIGKQGSQQTIVDSNGLTVATTSYSGGTYVVGTDATFIDDEQISIGHTTGILSGSWRATLSSGKETLSWKRYVADEGIFDMAMDNQSRFYVSTLSGKRGTGNTGTTLGYDFVTAEDGIFDQVSANSLVVDGNIYTDSTLVNHGASFLTRSGAVNYNATLSSDTAGTGVYFREATGDDNIGYIRSFGRSGSERLRGLQLGGHNIAAGSNVWNFLYLLTDKDGNRVVQVSERVPWIKALSLAYTPGDTFSDTIHTAGYVTNSGKDIYYTIPLVKGIEGTLTLTSMTLVARQGGNYIVGSGSSGTNVKSLATVSRTAHGLGIKVSLSSAPSGVTNNDVVGIACAYAFSVS